VEQDKDEIVWAISIWKVSEFQTIPFRHTCGFLWRVLTKHRIRGGEMTPAQIFQAQQMTGEWKKQHPEPAIY